MHGIKRKDQKKWYFVIKPRRHLLEINFREIWSYKDLIIMFVKRDFVAFYKQTILGPLWYIIQPLLMTLIFTVIFGNVAGMSTDGLPKILFYLSGLTAWNYFGTCLKQTSGIFINNSQILGKVYFPRLCMPISTIISTLVQFFIQFGFLLCFMIYFWIKGANFRPNNLILIIPLLILMLGGLSLGFGILIAALTTKYRDLRFVIEFGVQLWMYATPVIYPISQLPDKYKNLLSLNPVAPIIETFRFVLLGAGNFSWGALLYSFIFMLIILTLGIVVFNKIEQHFMDTI